MGAVISEDGLYRYTLTRDIDAPGKGTVTFVMLNPSTADAEKDDPTIRRCMGFARKWYYAQLKVVNLYAFRATNPRDLWLADDPVGPDNDHHISLVFGGSDLIIAAWGVSPQPKRLAQFARFDSWRNFHALGLTNGGFPRHPLYVRKDVEPMPFRLKK